MRIDPRIAALRNDPVAQRQQQARMDAAGADWKAQESLKPLIGEFERYASGASLSELHELDSLVTDAARASSFLDGWLTVHLEALADAQFAQIPYRHSYAAEFATVQILAEKGATLALAVYEERADPVAPTSAIFSDREQHEIVVAGTAQGLFSTREVGCDALTTRGKDIAIGDAFSLDCNREVRQWVNVQGQLVILQLSRTPEHPKPTREVRLEDGALLMQSDGDKRASQSSMALAVLGAMERTDAVPLMERMTVSGPAHLRWEAARQMLTLDPFRGIATLDRMSTTRGDELAEPARQLAAQLRAQYPALQQGKAA